MGRCCLLSFPQFLKLLGPACWWLQAHSVCTNECTDFWQRVAGANIGIGIAAAFSLGCRVFRFERRVKYGLLSLPWRHDLKPILLSGQSTRSVSVAPSSVRFGYEYALTSV